MDEKCFYCERVYRYKKPSFYLRQVRVLIIPESAGGKDDENNAVICCRFCAALKDDLTPQGFVDYIDETKKEREKIGGEFVISIELLDTIKKNAQKQAANAIYSS